MKLFSLLFNLLVLLLTGNVEAQTINLETNIRLVKDTKNVVKDRLTYNITIKLDSSKLDEVIFDEKYSEEGDFSYNNLTKIGVKEKDNILVEVFDTDLLDNNSDLLMILYEDGELKAINIQTIRGITLSYFKGVVKETDQEVTYKL